MAMQGVSCGTCGAPVQGAMSPTCRFCGAVFVAAPGGGGALPAQRPAPAANAYPDHEGPWDFTLQPSGDVSKINALKIVRDIADWGLREAKNALETPGARIPIANAIARGSSHPEIRQSLAACGYSVTFIPAAPRFT